MYVQYARELNPEDFDPPVAAKVHLILVHAGNISRSIHELIGVISDQTWIERLGVIPRASFERTALRTIAQLVAQFRAADNKLNSNIGEYLVSVSAAQGMEESFGHKVFPISELWKEKVSNNHGFDFHTESNFEVISFGEAKYNSNSNPYDDAADQVLRFLADGKHLGDAVCLQYFVSSNSMENLVCQDVRGAAIAFSLSAVNPLGVLSNCLDNPNVIKLAGLCDELYVVGVIL
ncbi:hypothetical protein [Pseudomonas aeruginosa]|uniref:hypothetical protein n=1 Tax=Pseudomonas aeruginosa TaxID=287 RepID=UPI000F5296A2|nr:hypothetical protein [Pseudomonas aeruginosa]